MVERSAVPDAAAASAAVTPVCGAGSDAAAHSQAELVAAALGGRLRDLIDPPTRFCYSAFAEFDHCPLSYALKYVCGLTPPEPIPAFVFGSAAHRAFELFTRLRRERAAAGEAAPVREDLDRCFAEAWESAEFPTDEMKRTSFARVGPMLDRFWNAEAQRERTTIAEEAPFAIPLELPDGTRIDLTGIIDRLDRTPDGLLELVDYKTGPAWGSTTGGYSLQLAIYALGCRDALGLGVPRRALLYFVEHALFAVRRVDDTLVDGTRAEVGERAAAIRSSDFAPTPSRQACRYCDFANLCPARVATSPEAA